MQLLRKQPVPCHLRQQPQPQTLPLITPQRTVGWFAKTHKPKQFQNAKIIKTAKPQKTSRGMPILAICSLTRSVQSKLFGRNRRLRAMGQTDIATTRLNRSISRFWQFHIHLLTSVFSVYFRSRKRFWRKRYTDKPFSIMVQGSQWVWQRGWEKKEDKPNFN